MPRSGSGQYNRAVTPYQNGTTADATVVNTEMNDIASALTQSLSKDGQTTPTGNLPMGSNRHTGVGNAAARSDYAAAGQVQDSAFLWCGTAGGTANALTLSPSPAITAYAAGQVFYFTSSASPNTAATTVAISGLATKAIQNNVAACIGGEIEASKLYAILYDGTAFQLLKLSIAPGGPYLDTSSVVMGSADKTKQIRIEVDGLTTATVRVLTAQDRNITIADILDNHGKCRLTFQSSTQVRLIPYNGSRIVINGSIQIIPSAGVNLSNSGLTAATLYYIYAYMSAGVMTLEASATTHATDTTTGVEIKNGDATRTLVGMVYMGAGSPGTFVDSVTQRFVASWFNRRERELYASANPGSKTNTSVGELNASLQLQFVTWADEAWDARTFGTMYLVTAAVTSTTYLSFGIDSTSASTAGTEIYLQENGTTFSTPTPAGTQVSRTSSEGFHFVTPLNRVSGNTHTYDVFNAVAGVRI